MSFQVSFFDEGRGAQETGNWIYASRTSKVLRSDGFRGYGYGKNELAFWDSLVRDSGARMLIAHDTYEYAHVAQTPRELLFPQGRYFQPLGFVCNKQALHFGVYGREKLKGGQEKFSTFLFVRNGKKNPFKFSVRGVSPTKIVDFAAAKLFNPGFEQAYLAKQYLWVHLDSLPLFAPAKRGEPRTHLPTMLTNHAKKLQKLHAIAAEYKALTGSSVPHLVQNSNGLYHHDGKQVKGYKTISEPVTLVNYGLVGEVSPSTYSLPNTPGALLSLYKDILQEASNLQFRIRVYTLVAEVYGEESIKWGEAFYKRQSVTRRETHITVGKVKYTLQRVATTRMMPRSVKEDKVS